MLYPHTSPLRCCCDPDVPKGRVDRLSRSEISAIECNCDSKNSEIVVGMHVLDGHTSHAAWLRIAAMRNICSIQGIIVMS
jgi:hypothetical protein